MKAVITTDSISLLPLRGRHLDESSNYHGQYIPPTASRQAPPVHEATGGHAVRGNYCRHNHSG